MRLAASPEDFLVDEEPLYAATGEGAHTFVRIEKRLRNTEEVARALARLAGVRPADVGYAGRKDRVAIARQWLSVPGLDPEQARGFEGDGFRVLEAVRHPHKLRTGQLRANRFELLVRELSPSQVEQAEARLLALVQLGMPNRFGAQRFGRDGRNAEAARALLSSSARSARGAPAEGRLADRGEAGRDRRAARFLLSALQAEVWNACLAARTLPLDQVEAGEVAFLHESGASFVVEDVEREAARAACFEISAAGPIFGTRLLPAAGAPAQRERELFTAHGIPDPLRLPPGLRLRGARRPFRVRPEAAHCEPVGADGARLCFTLPPGSYATVLVEELFAGADGQS
jgi:tRNA pseudouridine13 synthase